MDPKEFKEKWGTQSETLFKLGHERLSGLKIKASTAEFLTTAGLPQSAAPFLSFGDPNEDPSPFGLVLPEVFSDLGEEFQRYMLLGFDGSGNPIAVDMENEDQIVWMDHEVEFVPAYMNSSIGSLAFFLLGLRDFIQGLISTKGDDAYLDGNYDDSELELLRRKLATVDPQAFDDNNFWAQELGTLQANQASRQ